MNILFASHTYIGGPFVVGSHHLARELSGMGHRVLHLSTPVTPAHLLKVRERPIRERFEQWRGMVKRQQGNMMHVVPLSLIPWAVAGRIFRRTGANWLVRSIRFPSLARILRDRGFADVDLLLIDQPYFAGIEKYVNAKVVVYRPTDHYAEMSGDRTVLLAEREIVAGAHGMVATSESVLRSVQRFRPGIPSMILENGVEFEHFAQGGPEPGDLKSIPGPRAVYMGAVDERLDLEALRLLAECRPELSLIVIGPYDHAAVRKLGALANVHLLGPRPYADLPAYLNHVDFALLPFSDHSANRGRSPMKLYEYAAAGLQVIVRETPELLRRKEDFLVFYRDRQELVARAGEMLERRSGRQQLSRERIRSAARQQSWRSKAERLHEFCGRLGEQPRSDGIVPERNERTS